MHPESKPHLCWLITRLFVSSIEASQEEEDQEGDQDLAGEVNQVEETCCFLVNLPAPLQTVEYQQ
jgi:hypothetical protein